jgi:hypothetical protein
MNIIQIGTHKGSDEVHKIVWKNAGSIEKCVLVDINKKALDFARDKYKKYNFVEILNVGILPVDVNAKVTFYAPKSDELSQLCGISEEHIMTHMPKCGGVNSFSVQCRSLTSLLEEYSKTTHLFIDTEGLDALNLLSVDWDLFSVREIVFEHIHTDGPKNSGPRLESLRFYLKQFGYRLSKHGTFNLKAIKH